MPGSGAARHNQLSGYWRPYVPRSNHPPTPHPPALPPRLPPPAPPPRPRCSPQMANNLEGGGRTPLLPPQQLRALGFKIVAYPLSLLGVSIRAMETVRQKGCVCACRTCCTPHVQMMYTCLLQTGEFLHPRHGDDGPPGRAVEALCSAWAAGLLPWPLPDHVPAMVAEAGSEPTPGGRGGGQHWQAPNPKPAPQTPLPVPLRLPLLLAHLPARCAGAAGSEARRGAPALGPRHICRHPGGSRIPGESAARS